MISTRLLNEINLNLQLAKDNSELFGGLNVLFAGDLFQLSPFKGNALFYRDKLEKNLFSDNNSINNSQSLNGRNIWLQLTHTIILDIQCRQLNDPLFSSLLYRLRHGKHTSESLTKDYKLLSDRILNKTLLDGPDWLEAKIIVSKNTLREEINKKKIKEHSIYNNSNIYICKSEIVKTMIESKTGNLMTELPLVYNAKYFITKNMATKHGIVNKMEVLLKGFCTQEDNIVSLNVLSNSEIILNEMPKYLIVEPVIVNLHNPLNFPNINQRCIPIFPEEIYFYVKNDKPELSKQK